MKKLVAGAVALSMGAATMVQAGGVAPVIVEDAPVIIAESPGSSMSPGLVIGGLLLIAVIAAIASSDSDDDSGTTDGGEGDV